MFGGDFQIRTNAMRAFFSTYRARLKNIEETERAKRKLLAERSTTRINTERVGHGYE